MIEWNVTENKFLFIHVILICLFCLSEKLSQLLIDETVFCLLIYFLFFVLVVDVAVVVTYFTLHFILSFVFRVSSILHLSAEIFSFHFKFSFCCDDNIFILFTNIYTAATCRRHSSLYWRHSLNIFHRYYCSDCYCSRWFTSLCQTRHTQK